MASNQHSNNTNKDNVSEMSGFFGGSSQSVFLKITGIIAAVAVVTLVIVLPVYFTVIEPNNEDNNVSTPDESERFDCLPGQVGTPEECENRGCSWIETSTDGAPNCYYSGPSAYVLEGDLATSGGVMKTVLKLREENAGNYYGPQFPKLTVQTTPVSETTLRLKIYPDETRYEAPIDHPTSSDDTSTLYTAEHTNDGGKFGVKITRKQTSKTVIDTSVGELMFADQFLQISTKVASEYIYGFGEHMHRSFKHDMNWKTYGMFSFDQNVALDYNLYGVQTYFMCMEGDGNAYGVFFVNSNAMEVQLQPTPAITYRTIGGLLDFYIFMGPSPEDVTKQYMGVIGRPYFPPYWSLGFQLCRWNYGSLDKLSTVVNRTLASGIPYDVQYSDIDYMERQMDFTIDNETYYGITDFVLNLKRDHNMRYIIILDPAISGNETDYPPFDNGIRDDIFIKYENGDIAWGKVWPDLPNITVDDSKDRDYQIEHYRAHAAYPDFFHPNATKWWKELIIDFRNKIEFDALWIDMNEPTSFTNGTPGSGCPESIFDQPPYYPNLVGDNIYDLTICMQALQYHPRTSTYTQFYNLHSMYGYSEVEPTLKACRESTGERCLVLTRSTFPGASKNAGHWLGDNRSTWEHLRASIIGMMEYSMFGYAYNGADVCGFFLNTTQELCRRWMQVGAFYPFYRNHNVQKTIDQDPAVFGQKFVDDITEAMNTRYQLLPYLYTLFYEAHTTGSTVVRSLMHQFPTDLKTYTIETQFLWGPSLLITAVLEEGAESVTGYFPEGRWYNYYNGEELESTGTDVELQTPLDKINVHVLGGHILPTQQVRKNTFYSRQLPLGIIAALDKNYEAKGQLFWDDGNSVDTISDGQYSLISFNSNSTTLSITVSKEAPASLNISGLYFETVSIYGINGSISRIDIESTTDSIGKTKLQDRVEGSGSYSWQQESEKIMIEGLELTLDGTHYITWS